MDPYHTAETWGGTPGAIAPADGNASAGAAPASSPPSLPDWGEDRSRGAVAATTPRLLSSPQSGKLGGEDAGAAPADAFPSAGAIAPGVALHVSAVWYRSIRPLRHSLVKTHGGVPVRFRFTPRLDLVPGTLSQPRQRLRLRCLRKLHRRKSRRAQKRIHERAILRPQPRHFTFEQPDVTPLK